MPETKDNTHPPRCGCYDCYADMSHAEPDDEPCGECGE